MLRIRLILAWLLLAALPLQGWAAATMLFCGPAQPGAVVAKAEAATPGASDHHHDAHHHAQAGHADHGDSAAPVVADASHTCGVCAACCHGVAIAQTQNVPAAAAPPSLHLAEPLVAVLAHPSPVPDKPPRA